MIKVCFWYKQIYQIGLCVLSSRKLMTQLVGDICGLRKIPSQSPSLNYM